MQIKKINKQQRNRRGNQEWTIQKNCQHWVHKTQDEDNKTKHHTLCVGHYHAQDARRRETKTQKKNTKKTKQTKKTNKICVGHHYSQDSTNNVNKT